MALFTKTESVIPDDVDSWVLPGVVVRVYVSPAALAGPAGAKIMIANRKIRHKTSLDKRIRN